jgi:hypothetical protein
MIFPLLKYQERAFLLLKLLGDLLKISRLEAAPTIPHSTRERLPAATDTLRLRPAWLLIECK